MEIHKEQNPKLARVVVERIQDDIANIGWPVGRVLGSEIQLMATYGVSRSTLREAVRQLERHGVVAMRRGAGGGLVVREPARMAVVQALATYLELTDVSLSELFEARGILEMRAAELAIPRLSGADIDCLQQDVRLLEETPFEEMEREVRLYAKIRAVITAAGGNPALALFLESLQRVTRSLSDLQQLTQMWDDRLKRREAMRQLVEAIISGDAAAAQQAVQTELGVGHQCAERNLAHFERQADKGNPLERGAAPQIADWDASRKLPHRLAVAIAREVAQHNHPPGARIGSETEFLARFKVSRAVFREAVRVLEGCGIVFMGRGSRGGLMVGDPNPACTVSLVTKYLRYTSLGQRHFCDMLQTLQLAAVPLATTRVSLNSIAGLQAAIADLAHKDPRTIVQGLQDNCLALNRCIGNRAVALIGSVINAFASGSVFELPPPDLCQAFLGYQQEVLAAIAANDRALARRKTLSLFRAAGGWWGEACRKN